jgi:hypothetical protein
MYAYSGLGSLGASTPAQTLQKRIAAVQKKISSFTTEHLAKAKTDAQKQLWQAKVTKLTNTLTDLQTQAAQASVVPPLTPPATTQTTTETPLTTALPLPGSGAGTPTTPGDTGGLVPWNVVTPSTVTPTVTPTASGTPAAVVDPASAFVNEPSWFSNPWLIGGGLLLLLTIKRR